MVKAEEAFAIFHNETSIPVTILFHNVQMAGFVFVETKFLCGA